MIRYFSIVSAVFSEFIRTFATKRRTMVKNDIVSKGKRLAFLLRHDKDYAFDEHGWRTVSDLIAHHGYSLDDLKEIVATNNKQRFEFSDDMKCIRARQGHSVQVDAELMEATPPDMLFHGTSARFLDSIKREGLKKMNRLHVHLSPTAEIAESVGKRHGEPFLLLIDAKQMAEDGCKFYLSRNGVWLTDKVDVKYIKW